MGKRVGACDQLFQLAFDVGVADVLVFENAVGVDGKRGRNCVDPEAFGNRAVKPTISILKPGHLVLCDELFPLVFVFIEADADDDERLLLEAMRYVAYVGQGLATGTAPRRPEIDENNLAREAVERNVLAVYRGNGKRRRHAGASKIDAIEVA